MHTEKGRVRKWQGDPLSPGGSRKLPSLSALVVGLTTKVDNED